MCKILLMWVGVVALNTLTPCWADALAEPPQSGLDSLSWGRLQGRLAVTTTSSLSSLTESSVGTKLSSVALIGNYYLSPSLSQLSFSGLRATSGLMVGRRTSLWGMPGSGGTAPFSVDRRSFADTYPPDGSSNTPYIGIGYSSTGGKGNWGFSADLGLMSLSPGSIVRLGRVFNGGQNLDDVVRDMRLSPMVQLGISYSF